MPIGCALNFLAPPIFLAPHKANAPPAVANRNARSGPTARLSQRQRQTLCKCIEVLKSFARGTSTEMRGDTVG
jgi:hypothetical protein